MLNLNIEQSFIAIDGMPGSGKKFLMNSLAQNLNLRIVKDDYLKNPFLKKFYEEPDKYDLSIQLHYLMQRYNQQQEIMPNNLFSQGVVTNYLFAKDQIYARFNLDDEKFILYNQILSVLNRQIPVPDIVIYLCAQKTDTLLNNIRLMKRPFEDYLSLDYLDSLNSAYNYFFEHYEDSPLLILNIDDAEYDIAKYYPKILEELQNIEKGTKVIKL